MPELPNWEDVVVPQRHLTGCIPTGYEWIIRYLNIPKVDFETFQEDFDLKRANNFVSVADKIRSRFPHIKIEIPSFDQGLKKVRTIRMLIENHTPCLISLALGGISGWHVMPVVYIDKQRIRMIHSANKRGNHTWGFPTQEVVWRHDNMQGGKDIAWIKT